MATDFAEVLISVREPYNKNTLWIKPIDDNIEFNIFDKGWKTVITTKDLGLSNKSEQQVIDLINESEKSFKLKLNKINGNYKNSVINLIKRNRELEQRVFDLENKIDKLVKRYGTLLGK